MFHTLKRNVLPGDIVIHSDLLSSTPCALSSKRASKVGKEVQDAMEDKKSSQQCLICDKKQNTPPGTSVVEVLFENRVASFLNDFPYLSRDQRVVFLWWGQEEDEDSSLVRQKCFHKYQLKDLEKVQLYWLLKGCIELGKNYRKAGLEKELEPTYEFMRMVVGFNLGKLAGQSQAHFHAQYGWEVSLERKEILNSALKLYFDELKLAGLIIDETERIKLIAPWTPKGQYALDIYFQDKFDFEELEEPDLKIFAFLGEAIIQRYLELGIQNLNIVFTNSEKGNKIQPLIAHFVPRVNLPALYEMKGVNVVDTPPQKIADEFRRIGTGKGINFTNLSQLEAEIINFDPEKAFQVFMVFSLMAEGVLSNKIQNYLNLSDRELNELVRAAVTQVDLPLVCNNQIAEISGLSCLKLIEDKVSSLIDEQLNLETIVESIKFLKLNPQEDIEEFKEFIGQIAVSILLERQLPLDRIAQSLEIDCEKVRHLVISGLKQIGLNRNEIMRRLEEANEAFL